MSRRKPSPVALRRASRLIPRLELAIALELYSEGDRDCLDMARLLRSENSEDRQCSASTLAQRLGLPFNKVLKVYQESKRAEAIIVVAQHLPDVAEGIAQEAKPRHKTCESCRGSGNVTVTRGDKTEEVTCLPCEGSGQVYVPGDPGARKQVLEMMSLTGQGASPIIAPGSQILINNGGSLEDTLHAARRDKTTRYEQATHRDQPQIEAGSERTGTDRDGTRNDSAEGVQHPPRTDE